MRLVGFLLAAFGCMSACVDNVREDDPAYRTGLYPKLEGSPATGAEILECKDNLSKEDQKRAEKALWNYSAALYGADTATRQKQSLVTQFRRCPDRVIAITAPDIAKGGTGLVGVLFLDPQTMQVLESTIGDYPAIVDFLVERSKP